MSIGGCSSPCLWALSPAYAGTVPIAPTHKGMARLSWLGLVTHQEVAHPCPNRARRRLTSQTETSDTSTCDASIAQGYWTVLSCRVGSHAVHFVVARVAAKYDPWNAFPDDICDDGDPKRRISDDFRLLFRIRSLQIRTTPSPRGEHFDIANWDSLTVLNFWSTSPRL